MIKYVPTYIGSIKVIKNRKKNRLSYYDEI
jgi:hypothetical protein